VSAGAADEAARRISLQPALVLAAIPDPIFRAEHPAPPFAVQHREVADRDSKSARLKRAGAALFHEIAVPGLGLCERIDRHAGIIANGA